MDIQEIIAALDVEIGRLSQARDAIAGISGEPRRGRPSVTLSGAFTGAKKRVLSAAARKKIADAQRKRWAAQKAARKVTVTLVPAKQKREHKPRSSKNAATGNALSSKSDVVVVPKS